MDPARNPDASPSLAARLEAAEEAIHDNATLKIADDVARSPAEPNPLARITTAVESVHRAVERMGDLCRVARIELAAAVEHIEAAAAKYRAASDGADDGADDALVKLGPGGQYQTKIYGDDTPAGLADKQARHDARPCSSRPANNEPAPAAQTGGV